MKRRDFLASGTGLGLAALAGCATNATGFSAAPVTGDALVQSIDSPMRPIKSSMSRVTRTIVGLRPFRKPGPRLEAARVGSKHVVHNYGHGGGGVSLSWGVAELATNLTKEARSDRVAVLGSGAIGLSTAILLQRAGAEVTIYAKDFPPYTTSNVAGAMWHPVTLFENDQVSQETVAMLDLASRIAFNRFIRFANDPKYGVYWIRQYSLSERPMSTLRPYVGGDALYPGLIRNRPGGPFGFPYYDAYYTLMIDPDIYLRALVNDFLAAGGRMKEMAFETEGDLEKLTEMSIVNCMGLGASKVFGDESIIPARGQLSFLLPQNDIDYGYAGSVDDYGLLYSFPRKTGILLGGSVDKGDWSLEPRADEIRRMVEGHAYLASKLT
ncbi:FAD-dependent oxidoreductase [Hyphomonas jannaschiana]|uniref:D-amino-acid oxidase n=1 Tax=Hyphomonas jannaschiana VP2 TaxID=1280952 RepID=A0A059F9C5_9PROT|nr:FAD-dependent oxidoreductase [Hyphomonas jannaschiana]KCZ87219.1 FAD-binding oxidoreductase [Hyphomonas jannaschiana VP2]